MGTMCAAKSLTTREKAARHCGRHGTLPGEPAGALLSDEASARRYLSGQTPGGQTITSKPVGIPPGVLPSTGVHAAGMGWQPSTVQAI